MKPINLFFISTLIIMMLAHSPMVMANSSTKNYDIQKFLVDEANRQSIDPALALAIAKVESDFNPTALSHAGAKGIMQIMPATAKGVFGSSPERLFDAKTNIELGISFIKQLLVRYDQRTDIALSHYNGGSAVQDQFGGLTVIPATQKYVNKVLSARENFKYKAYQLSGIPVKTTLKSNFESDFNGNSQGYLKSNLMAGISLKGPKQQESVFSTVTYKQIKAKNSIPQSSFAATSYDQPLYEKVEQLRTLRLHNIMRNTSSNLQTDTLANSSARTKVQTFSKPDIPLSEKRLKVLSWEKMFN